MKCKQSFCIPIICIALIFSGAHAQTPNIIPQNKHGVRVITTAALYNQTVTADSNNRMVPLNQYISPLFSDIQYATNQNFTKTVLYSHPRLAARLPVARALQKVQRQLALQGLSLFFYDAYRPYSVTEKMWEIVPDERYAADPAKGSGHNRGIAVDITLADVKTGKPVAMPTAFDNFTEKAHHNYMQLDSAVIANRALLKKVMEQNGFAALSTEWWHYSYTGASTAFAILDLPFQLFNEPEVAY